MKNIMKNITHAIENFWNNRSGSILGIGVFSVIGLVTATGAAVDAANYMNLNSRFKNAVDNAIVSAVPVARTQDINVVAREFFYANFPKKYHDQIDLGDVNIVENPETLEWEITVDADVKTNFAKHIGIDTFDISHTARVKWDIGKRVEIVFTFDTSASMCTDTVRSTRRDGTVEITYQPDYACEKLNAVKTAIKGIVDDGFAVVGGVESPLFHAGLVPYNHKIKFPNVNNIPLAFRAAEEASGYTNYYSDFSDAEPLSAMIPLTAMATDTDKTRFKQSVDAISQSPTGKGWTRSNISTLAAGMMLDPAHHSHFGGSRPEAFGTDNVDKIVVMMSDGANIGCCYSDFPTGDYSNQYLYLYMFDYMHLIGNDDGEAISDAFKTKYLPTTSAKGVCDQLKEENIVVYSVLLDVDASDPGGAIAQDAFRKCASSDLHYFNVSTASDVEKAYKQIADSFLKLRITY